ncbi:MAG: amino acid adenylation domain-containing protein, partial [Fulvivirga sp.]|uniref:non-ribosomal peptide synthetase n=1 Tax=Fulvivirga sp. TaxID=1931237 RepID=UPI0032ECFA86
GHITGSPTPLPLAKPYSHYISWLEERADEDSKAYWEKYLQGFDEMTGLPKRQHFDSNDTVFGWERELIIIDQDRVKQLDKIARQYNLTQNSIFTTIWAVLLSKLCNSDNVLFGSVVSGRPPELLNVDQMVGLFINTIPLRIQLDESDTFIDLIEKTQQNSLECKDHQYNSISEFYSMTELGWDLFDHVLVFQNYPRFSRNNLKDHLVREGEFQVEDEKGITQNNYDLWLNIIPGDQIKVNFEYNAAIYEPSQMAAIAAYFDQLMEQLLSDVKQPLNRINLIGKDQSLLLESFNQTLQPISRDKTYFQLFQEQATKDPNRVAVSHNGTSLTYSELLAQANKLARVLIQHGLKSGDRVGVLMPRGIDMLTSILAILRCRLVYVPVDVNYPSGRIEDILNDSEVKILLTSKAHDKHFEYTNNEFTKVYLDNLEDQTSTLLSINDGESQDLAYIIYTSGTTGKPKGVMIHQFGMINHLHAKISDLGISKNDVIAQTASPSFDISIWQFLAALLVGGKTVIIDREIVLDSNQLVKELQDHEISILESVPSLISAFLEGIDHNQNFTLESLRWMIPTGEQLYGSLVRKWYTKFPDIKLLNAYGPTEASDDVTHYVVPYPFEGKGNVPIGKPIQNMHVYIMDDHQNLCPPLIPGKICVSGIGVGQGYWKDPDKTSESFVKNSLANGNSDFTRLYITGDIGYYLPDGNIICLGRQDEQIKIRGNRVELSEIQTCFSAIDGVKESAIAMKDIIGSAELIAYYIADNELAYKAVKNQLAAKLPEYMIPAHIIRLEKFPLTTNGKLDKKSLPLPTITKSAAHQGPKNDTQQRLCEIWGQILGIDPDAIGIDQNFFELGGQSLRAINFLNSLEKEFETRIFLAEFFESPTISSVAEHIMISSITEESKNSENKITL